jgi:hypothetical protein
MRGRKMKLSWRQYRSAHSRTNATAMKTARLNKLDTMPRATIGGAAGKDASAAYHLPWYAVERCAWSASVSDLVAQGENYAVVNRRGILLP